MTKAQIKAEIATIRKCEKAIYDYDYRQILTHNIRLIVAQKVLYRKRKRLEAKLK